MKHLVCIAAVSFCITGTVCATEIPVLKFADWKISGNGKLVDGVLQITGNGKNSGNWSSPNLKLQPGGYYRFSVEMLGVDASGNCLPCGPNNFHRDFSAEKGIWKTQSYGFRVPEPFRETQLRAGQWESAGTFQFRNIKLETITPVLKQTAIQLNDIKAVLALGSGEMIQNGTYFFNARFGGEGSNIHRPLDSAKVGFNSNRWCFSGGSELTYRFSLVPKIGENEQPPILFDSGTFAADINLLTAGEGVAEISADGETRWTELGRFNKAGSVNYTLPPIAFPLEEFFIRLRGLNGSNFQIDGIRLESPLVSDYRNFETKTLNAAGETLFATSTGENVSDELFLSDNKIIAKTAEGTKEFPLQVSPSPGKITQKIDLGNRTYTVQTETHPLNRSDYGYYINDSAWWAEADWKVGHSRPAPNKNTAKPAVITAAKNDTEMFQIVIRADEEQAVENLTATVSELKTANGAVIPKENIEVLYGYYHFVHSKTDGTGYIGDWVDALPPLKELNIPAGKNQPIFISVKVPAEAAGGSYAGVVNFSAQKGLTAFRVPFTINVWNFALPKENHHETAYGFSEGLAFQYHNAKTEADKRKVLEMYLQLLSDYRISIYRPTPLDNFTVKWLPDEQDGAKSRCELDFTKFDAEMQRVLDKFHFTNFTVPGHGLGGGTFHDRYEPSLGKFGVDTPQYKAMMTSYYSQLVNHLKEKNWLDKAYVYWFDEPAAKDYKFVAQGTARLQHYADGLARMMTLMMSNTGFLGALDKEKTSVNVWCTISNHFVDDLAAQRRAKGERFWWYICTGPKAPYCTLFIDHPATELRVWHWQAFQRHVAGSLIWQTNYWTSGSAFPGGYQNPYEDPMGYVSGYSTPAGTKAKWGNGDGRFIYPPLSAAVPGLNDGKPNFDKPVASIRWAMIREGVEDYEMFYLLQELLKHKGSTLSEAERKAAEELLNVPETVTKSMTEFTIDPRPVLEHRNKIGVMIEKLAK